MKNRLGRYLAFGAIGIILAGIANGCGPVRVTEQFQKFNRIYVGWVDFGEQNWTKYGYGTKGEWTDEIRTQNIDSLQSYTRGYMKGWNVIGADSRSSVTPWDQNTLVILFSHVSLTPGTNQFRCEMSFYDGGTRKLLKRVNEQPSPISYNPYGGWSNASFSGQLSNSMSGVAYDIKYYLTSAK
ncbi:MAG: hypothetical protein M1517_10810 [Deltaproteobacteria bacterium]|nr:hypothetical protein [Deltaproteobacteria bacterium]